MATGDAQVQGNQAAAANLGISLPGVGSGGTAPVTSTDVANNQAAAAKLGVSIPGVNGAAPPPPVSQTQNAGQINNHLSGQTSGVVFPPPPAAPTQGRSANASVPNPTPNGWDPQTYANFKAANPGLEPNAQDTAIMQASGNGIASPQSIIDQGNVQTPAEIANQTLLQKVADLIKNKKGQTTLTNQAESAAGIPALTKTVSDLNTQLEGLNNQALDLQNQARPGGAIENQEQQNALGRGITAAGLAPLTAGDLRKNQIQQSAIASQALTLKSAIYGAQGKLTLAKDAADKAAQAQYEDQQNQIDYQNALIAANLPQMTKEEKNQALLIQTQLQDRQTQIQQAQEDKKTIIAMATQVMQEHPNDPQAQYAAQQALSESNQQQPNLQKVLGLIGHYQSLDTQIKAQQLVKARNEAIASQPTSPNDPTATNALDPNSQSILAQTGLSVAAFNYLTQGTAALSRLSATDRKNIMNEASNFLNKNGLDYSTFQSQYKAQNDVLQKNVERAANTKVFAGEVAGSADALASTIDQKDLQPGIFGIGKFKAANLLSLATGKQVNDPLTLKYSTQLATMVNDYAGFLAASRGSSQPENADLQTAANVVSNGLNKGSVQAFKDAINTNEQKVSKVVNGAVDDASKSVWEQFGVADKYQSKISRTTKSGKPFDVAGAKAAGYSDAQIQAYLDSH